MFLKIGELAKRTGVTIRALRHYDEIGLLAPSARSAGGYRLYDQDDIGRLYRIQALSRLDLPLAEIGRVLSAGDASLPLVVAKQIAFLNSQISHATALRDHLSDMQGRLHQGDAPAMDDWLTALEQMSAASSYFNDEQLRALAERRGAARQTWEDEKASLIGGLEQLMAQGIAADSDLAQDLGYRWISLLMEEVGGDEGLLMKYYAMQWNEASLQSLSRIDQARMTYISHAMAYRRLAIYAKYCTADEVERLRRHYVMHTTSWPPLIAAIRSHLESGTDPLDPVMQFHAKEWSALSVKKVGGDLKLAEKLRQAFVLEPALRFGSGIDPSFLDYIGKALQPTSP